MFSTWGIFLHSLALPPLEPVGGGVADAVLEAFRQVLVVVLGAALQRLLVFDQSLLRPAAVPNPDVGRADERLLESCRSVEWRWRVENVL